MWESYSKTLSNLKEALLEPCCSLLSCVQLSATPKTIAYQASLSMGIPRQEDQRGLPIPSAGELPHPGTEPMSPALSGEFITTEPPGKFILDLLHRP